MTPVFVVGLTSAIVRIQQVLPAALLGSQSIARHVMSLIQAA